MDCVKAAGPDDSHDANSQRERYGSLAVELLKRAVDGGFRNVSFLRSTNQLDPIRDRPDFKALVRKLESNSVPAN
jgi:hypothetical protein